MPCDSSYLEPTAKEIESRIVCGHLAHIYKTLSQLPPYDFFKKSKDVYGDPDNLDAHTALLCEMMQGHGETIHDRLSGGRPADLRLWLWWTSHLEQDQNRKQAEKDSESEERERDLLELNRLLKKYPSAS